jgi:hypothetical protein
MTVAVQRLPLDDDAVKLKHRPVPQRLGAPRFGARPVLSIALSVI